jgi:homoserine kinase type II
MSVFTAVSGTDLTRLLAEAGLRLLDFRPASSGIENSNYLIDACGADGERSDVVLTLFEQMPAGVLPWYADLLAAVAKAGLPVPCPIAHPRGTLFSLAGKPAMLVPRLPGQHIDQPDADHCRQIGAALARLHQVSVASPAPQADERQLLASMLAHLPDSADKTRAEVQLRTWLGLAWCLDGTGQPLATLQEALLTGYGSERSLSTQERSYLPLALAIAAMRFWLSRLGGQSQQALEGQGSKDPAPFHRLWQLRSQAL